MKYLLMLCSLLTMNYGLCHAQAAWQTDGVPVCTAGGDQQNPVIVPDLKGGGIVIWQDNRGGNLDIYAQRVDSAGNRVWGTNGVAIAASGVTENGPRAVSDMRGGAIIVFNKGSYNIWMQRVDSAGNVCWGVNGKAMCDNDSLQMSYHLCSDSAGGAIITWANADTFATGLADWDACAQRVDSMGNVLWGASGIIVAGDPDNQAPDGIVEDKRGGAIVYWSTRPTSFDVSLYAMRINNNGDTIWPGSVPICTLTGERGFGGAITDQSGGGVCVWKDKRGTNWDIYAQRVDSSGNMRWQLNGVPVCTAAYMQDNPVIASDGCGGGIISWDDSRTISTTHWDIYTQRLDSLGNVLWATNGIQVCDNDSLQSWSCITATDTGKTAISWFDTRSGQYDIYAQAVNGDGSLEWSSAGLAVCTATGVQFNDIYSRQNQIITADRHGGVMLVWHDNRNGNYDIYAQKLHGINGVAGEPIGVVINKLILKVYPNPFMCCASVEGLPLGAEAKVYDITGRLMKRYKKGVMGNELKSGVYFLSASGCKPVKMIKLK
jgi:beta propeller repeat protein